MTLRAHLLVVGTALALAAASHAQGLHRLAGPPQVEAGARFEVRLEGEAVKTDLITIVPAGTADGTYAGYVAAKRSPVELRAPLEPGDHELRWLRYASPGYDVLSRAPIQVLGVAATLSAPPDVAAGSPFDATWSGPAHRLDRIAIQDPGAAANGFSHAAAYTRDGSPAHLTAPGEPGAYVLRYLADGSPPVVLAEVPLVVTDVSATVVGPTRVVAGTVVEVRWTGPALELDHVVLARADDPGHAEAFGYTRRGNPLELEAPDEPGAYVLGYVSGKRMLAKTPLEVVPAPRAGFLEVNGASRREGTGAVELILDASGSMLQKLGGRARIEIARDALVALVRDEIPAGTPFALRVFGHREADRCRSDLEMPLAPLDAGAAVARIGSIQARNLARTPIAASLALTDADLAGVSGERVVILVTDGEETCDGDPEAEIRKLRDAGVELRLNIVGFAIDESALERQFARWAELGHGVYLPAADAQGLTRAVQEAARPTFEVVDFEGRVVATGVVGAGRLELLPGDYQIRWRAGDADHDAEVHVTGGETTVHEIARP